MNTTESKTEQNKPARHADWNTFNKFLDNPLKLEQVPEPEVKPVCTTAVDLVLTEPVPPKRHNALFVVALVCLLCLASYYLISRFCISSVQVSGRSMQPTLHDGERYLLNRLCYLYREPLPGEVVVIRDPGHKDFAVKRIVAGPSDRVSFEAGHVVVNGKELKETYLASGTETLLPQSKPHLVVLGRNQYFVLGDNRNMSEDSRFYGAINRSQIVGPIWR